MGITIAADVQPFPATYTPPLIYRKKNWDGEWQFDPELEFVSADVYASSIQAGELQFERKYGTVKAPYDNAFAERQQLNWLGYWVKCVLPSAQGMFTMFVGRVESVAQEMMGSETYACGTQTFIASDGLRILEKMHLNSAYFLNSDETISLIDWLPPMNSHDHQNTIVGNRTAATDVFGIYYYGGTDVWTHAEYVQYLIANFINQTDSDGHPTGPQWSLGGQVSVIDAMKTTVNFSEGATIAEILHQLIHPKYGVDFYVNPTSDGYQINVFVLSSREASVAGVTMPKNPSVVTIEKGKDKSLIQVDIVETQLRKFDRIEICGRRIVVCGTLYGPKELYPGGTAIITTGQPATLVPKWGTLMMPDPDHPGETIPRPNSIEQDYINAGGLAFIPDPDHPGEFIPNPAPGGGPGDYDEARKRSKYETVYQLFGAPFDWDLDGGNWSLQFLDDGVTLRNYEQMKERAAEADPESPALPPNYQTKFRSTLGWLPMKDGFDYSTVPPTDNTIADGQHQPTLKPPIAWIVDDWNVVPEATPPILPKYVQVDLAGVGSIHGPQYDWGIFINASPNHKLAKNHWTDEQEDSTAANLEYDYDTLITTIAIECDHCVRIGSTLPENMRANDGSKLIIKDDLAECWVLLPSTVIDLNPDGTLKRSPGTLQVLRVDTNRLAMVMAGAIARYINDRVKASLVYNGTLPYSTLIGQILGVVQQGAVINTVGAPITSVSWRMQGQVPTTMVKTGYAS